MSTHDKVGRANKENKVVFPFQYEKAFSFANGKGLIYFDQNWYEIDIEGKIKEHEPLAGRRESDYWTDQRWINKNRRYFNPEDISLNDFFGLDDEELNLDDFARD